MVGRQTSPKCNTCRKRKVRCDLLEPACTACRKSGWDCPGYPDRFVRDASMRPHKATKATDLEVTSQSLPRSESRPTYALISKADNLRLEFLIRMEGDVLAARLAMMPATHILKHVPMRIGMNRALDDACSCIMNGPSSISKASRLYGRALVSLRTSLADRATARAPETLAAASLLQMYEQYSDYPSQQWVHHARGVVKMLQARGASNIHDAMERAILEAQAGNVFMSTWAANRECFLAHPAWQQVLKPQTAHEGHLDVFMKMIVAGAQNPDIDHLCASLVRQCEYDYATPLRHRVMVGTAALMDMLRMRVQLKDSMDADSGSDYEHDIRDPIKVAAYATIGFFVITTNTILLGLHKQLAELSPDRQPQWPKGITETLLKEERLAALERVNARFKQLAGLDDEIRYTAPAALRVILATVLGINGTTNTEAATLLMVLDSGLQEAHWEQATRLPPSVPNSLPLWCGLSGAQLVEAA